MDARGTDSQRLRIGQVCDVLRAEFPDITISKLRFLQDKGIVDPERTPGGYRMYSTQDVQALRVALRMQRDQFMPLKVIRGELQRMLEGRSGGTRITLDTSSSAGAAGRAPGTLPPAGDVRLDAPEHLVTAEAVVRAASVSHEFLEECRSADIVSGRREADGTMRFTQDELGLVALAGQLAGMGFDVRHLRQAVMAMGRQGAMVEQYAAALLRAPGADTHERALRTVELLTSQLAEFMRIAFVRDVKMMTARAAGATGAAHATVPGARPASTSPLV